MVKISLLFCFKLLSETMDGKCLGSRSNQVLALSWRRSDQGALSKPFHKSLHSEKITSDILPVNIYIVSFALLQQLLFSHIPKYHMPYIKRHIKFHRWSTEPFCKSFHSETIVASVIFRIYNVYINTHNFYNIYIHSLYIFL